VSTSYSFTKLVVNDLEKMTSFYTKVYGLKQYDRVQSAIGADPIDEIMLGTTDAHTGGLILLKFTERAPTGNGEIILGFVTDDVESLIERVRATGGAIHAPIRVEPAYKVCFVQDPEGHLAEVVQVTASQ
jgi:predicted enzyme related to lactoylglutathione lyase